MNKIIFTISLLIISLTAINAQESAFTIDASQFMSSFSFKDSESAKQNQYYNPIISGGYGIGYTYSLNENIFLRGGIGMRNGGSSLIYDEMNYSWELKYLDLKVGGGYEYNIGKFSPYVALSFYYGYMLRGIQVLNNEELNITESGLLKRSDFGLIATPGIKFEISKDISTYFEFNYLTGLINIEEDPSQNAKNQSYALTLGLAFTIK